MTFQRTLLLAAAVGLAVAGGLAPADASARQQEERAQHDKHDKAKSHKGKSESRRNDATHRNDAAARARNDARRAQQQARIEAARRDAERRNAVARRDAERRADAARRSAEHRADADRRAAERRADDRRAAERREDAYRDARRHEEAQRREYLRDRQQLVAQQERREAEYRRHLRDLRAAEARRLAALDVQRRARQYDYQRWYWQQQQAMQARWVPTRYDLQRYYDAPVAYRYARDGRSYAVDRYTADLLRQAVRHGYEQGARAGRADRLDGWRSDWRNNIAYQDANYGYGGYYVDRSEYNYYFRQGFQRGYQDGYGNDYRHGTRYNRNDGIGNDGIAMILASVVQSILGLQQYRAY